MRVVPSRYTLTIPLSGGRMLAYNTASQTFALWDPEDVSVWERIEDGEISTVDSQALPFMHKRYAVFEGLDEIAAVEGEYSAARQEARTLQITVCTTLYCNFACGYCFQGMVKPSTKMSVEVREAIAEYARQTLPVGGRLSVCWYGGEPLMGQEALFDLDRRLEEVRLAKKAAKTGFIVTNGYLLTPEIANQLTEIGVPLAQVTLDGPQHMHDERRPLLSGRGSYQRILDNLVAVTESTSLQIAIRVNVDMSNRDAVYQMLQDLADRGLGMKKRLSVYFAPVEATTLDCASCESSTLEKEAYAAFEVAIAREANRLGLSASPPGAKFLGLCQAVRPRSIVVTPTGDVHKCWETVNQPELRHGTIFDMVGAEQSAISKRWNTWSPFENEVCRDCRILPMCAGACAFKTVHTEQQAGNSGLPCPSWKFNFAERMFLRAEQKGLVRREDWVPGVSDTKRGERRITGERHSLQSVKSAASRLDRTLAEVSA